MSVRINSNKLNKLKKGRLKTIGSSFIGVLIKDGKRAKALRIFENALADTCLELELPIPLVLRTVLHRISIPLEMRTVKRGKRVLSVPKFANRSRFRFLTVRNLVKDVREEKVFENMTRKLTYEFMSIVLARHSKTIEKMKKTSKEAVKNRSFIHYRW